MTGTVLDALGALDTWPVTTAAAAVVTGGGVLATHGPVEHVFALASVTKPLAALATLIAVEEGALELSEPADPSLIPGATLSHLLAHASGLAPERRLRSFAPAVRRVYSNVGIELAGELVEAAVEMPLARYFDQAIGQPLGLTSTSIQGSPAKDGRSCVSDLARLLDELLNGPRLLHPTTLAQATTVAYPGLRGVLPGFGAQDPNDWGLGFEIKASKRPHWTGALNSAATYGHFGQRGTMFWVDPVARVGLVALADEPFGAWAAQAWPALSDAVLAAI
ncbi:MAG TPA: serine hydrolase domain-containing protein [Jatrophihabitantaceae bacterium]|nr:serine hydrolase domain-containing protein [Jatrophihabitantaceae bacterium]